MTMSLNHAALERVFCYFDENGDGKISSAELRSCMNVIGDELSQEEAKSLIKSMDGDGDGLLRWEEFIMLVEIRDGREEGERDMREAFKMYGTHDDQGCITAKSLKRMLSKLGFSRNIEICEGVIHKFDTNGDGVLSYEEFKIMMMA